MNTMSTVMKAMRRLNRMHVISLAWILIVIGCGASSLPVTYYILNPMDDQASGDHRLASEALMLGIGPIRLPGYLDRFQMVTRTSPNRLKVDDFHRWAAPLEEEISRVLAENITQLTGIQRHVVYPWPAHQRPELSMALTIHAFEGRSDGTVTLKATMALRDWRNSGSEILPLTFHITQRAAAPGDYAAMVSAQSLALIELSRQIGEDILTLISQ